MVIDGADVAQLRSDIIVCLFDANHNTHDSTFSRNVSSNICYGYGVVSACKADKSLNTPCHLLESILFADYKCYLERPLLCILECKQDARK